MLTGDGMLAEVDIKRFVPFANFRSFQSLLQVTADYTSAWSKRVGDGKIMHRAPGRITEYTQ